MTLSQLGSAVRIRYSPAAPFPNVSVFQKVLYNLTEPSNSCHIKSRWLRYCPENCFYQAYFRWSLQVPVSILVCRATLPVGAALRNSPTDRVLHRLTPGFINFGFVNFSCEIAVQENQYEVQRYDTVGSRNFAFCDWKTAYTIFPLYNCANGIPIFPNSKKESYIVEIHFCPLFSSVLHWFCFLQYLILMFSKVSVRSLQRYISFFQMFLLVTMTRIIS